MFLLPAVNSLEMKKSASLLLLLAPPFQQCYETPIFGNGGVTEGTNMSSKICHNTLSQAFIPSTLYLVYRCEKAANKGLNMIYSEDKQRFLFEI